MVGDAAMRNITYEFDIHKDTRQSLLQLQHFTIVIVCADSGSMMTPVKGTRKTRWNQLHEIVKKVIQIALIFDPDGVDIHFLNGGKYPKVKHSREIDQVFERIPTGYTPLVPVLTGIFQSPMTRRGRDKKLLVFVVTDGKPTNDDGLDMVSELEDLMRHTRDEETTYVSFLLCTDEPECVVYLEKWDRTMKNVNVTDNYDTELRKIRHCQENGNISFTKDDYIMKALIGVILPRIDRLNERKRETIFT